MTTETDVAADIEQTAEQTAQAEKEAEAGFAAGFKKVSGKEPPTDEKPDTTDTASEAAAAAASAPEKSDAEKQAEETARAEADAKAAAEAAWQGVPAVVREKLQGFDALSGTVNKLAGHIGGLTNATQRIEAALKAAKSTASTAGGDAPSDKQVTKAMADPEAWAKLKEDFPDWAGPVEAEFAALRAEMKPGATVDVDSIKAEIRLELAGDLVEEKHEGWRETVKTEPFTKWMESQPDAMKALAVSPKPRDAIKVLDAFRADEKARADAATAAAEAEAVRLKKQKRLDAAIAPRGTGAAVQETGLTDEEAFAKGFKKVAKAR